MSEKPKATFKTLLATLIFTIGTSFYAAAFLIDADISSDMFIQFMDEIMKDDDGA